ncbi:MAG: alpha/beta hydrolase [Streptosporangiaceae bacterium]
MAYQFDTDHRELADARALPWAAAGVPPGEIRQARDSITVLWGSAPGSWPTVWASLAARYAAKGDHLRAATIYGIAKFPCLADGIRAALLDRQLEQYLLAAPGMPVNFSRQLVPTPHLGSRLMVPVHILSAPQAGATAPAIHASGGVDTWKMDQHRIFTALATAARCHVIAFDLPGTGELTDVPMTPQSGGIIPGLVAFARTLTSGRVGHLGISFGGHFSARSGLRGDVDAAVVLGGPVRTAFSSRNLGSLPHGMLHIIGNAMGLSGQSPADGIVAQARRFGLTTLPPDASQTPMLVINGDADRFIPAQDTNCFQGRRRTEVRILSGAGHFDVRVSHET